MAPLLDGGARADFQQEEGPSLDAAHDTSAVRGEGGAAGTDLPPRRRPRPRAGPVPAWIPDSARSPEGEPERPLSNPHDRPVARAEDQGTGGSPGRRPRSRRPGRPGGLWVSHQILGARGTIEDAEPVVRGIRDWAQAGSAEVLPVGAPVVFGRDHLESAIVHAERAKATNAMSAHSLSLQPLLYLSGRRQVVDAIPVAGLRKWTRSLGLVL